ncbi:UTP--glucose-1-phosphate uridylyltransferase GalU [Vibrio sp. F13]|uniref:UTP--glucose-1-phosphate uridylyltransferase GalU n=1 Tax=Vibrio sp. F13 TaxID=2070777 RepID=UPI0010BCFD70|nr:UTP--glucose-1-phosphate uridylyltransferase GalU [Vibrio sp. F13]TKF67353.1 UTP--glucose-1-phosphate uridylyltransferase GalU [Vibrio sp. F13]
MIKKCLFPASGYGTRFLPATKSMPKEMMPVVNKPLVEYGVEEAISAGMQDMCIVTGRGKHTLMDHFDKNYELEHQIEGTNKEILLGDIRKIIDSAYFTYIRQREMKGLGHAILTGRELVGDEPFAVILADDLCVNPNGDSVLTQMVSLYKQFRCSIVAVEEVPKGETHKYGVITGDSIRDDLFRVTDMIEKPESGTEPSNLAIIGRYILTPDIFDLIEQTEPGKGGEIQITDALLKQAKNGCVIAYKFKGDRFDCGSVEGYMDAINYCYKNIYLRDENINLKKERTEKELFDFGVTKENKPIFVPESA